MKQSFFRRFVGVPTTAGLLAACGGGGDSSSAAPVSLVKYEGTWTKQCAQPIQQSSGAYADASVRETLVITKPDSTGAVTIESIEEFFDLRLPCYDTTTPALATVRNVIPAVGRYRRQEVLAAFVGTATYDVLSIEQVTSAVDATGSGITSVDAGGVLNWRITFSDGGTADRTRTFAARSGEVGMLKNVVNPGQLPPNGFTEIRFYGDQEPYIKRAP